MAALESGQSLWRNQTCSSQQTGQRGVERNGLVQKLVQTQRQGRRIRAQNSRFDSQRKEKSLHLHPRIRHNRFVAGLEPEKERFIFIFILFSFVFYFFIFLFLNQKHSTFLSKAILCICLLMQAARVSAPLLSSWAKSEFSLPMLRKMLSPWTFLPRSMTILMTTRTR